MTVHVCNTDCERSRNDSLRNLSVIYRSLGDDLVGATDDLSLEYLSIRDGGFCLTGASKGGHPHQENDDRTHWNDKLYCSTEAG